MKTLLKATVVITALAAAAPAFPASAAGVGVADKSGLAAGGPNVTEQVHWRYRRYHRPRFYFYVGPGYHSPYYYRPHYYHYRRHYYHYRPHYRHYRPFDHHRPYRHYHRHWW